MPSYEEEVAHPEYEEGYDEEPESDYDSDEDSEEDEESADDLPELEPRPSALYLEPLASRPCRMLSFEQEVRGDRDSLALALYEAGHTSENRVWGYHSGSTEWLHMEDDSSVDGELIYSRIRLDRPHVAKRMEDALEVVQESIREGETRLDSRCGFHIHVGIGYDSVTGARCYGMESVQSLYHLWNHVEDVVYRLASANWRLHRSERGNDYSPIMAKGIEGVRALGSQLEHARGALNLSPFLGSRGECSCGAFRFGAWAECECSHLSKPTVEFRVFNATANVRKIRAYAALALALVAYAEENTVTAESHPVAAWRGTSSLDTETATDRLRFILRELELSDLEREDIRYCAETSAMGGYGSLKPIVAGIRRRKGYALSESYAA